MKLYHKKLSGKASSVRQHHISGVFFLGSFKQLLDVRLGDNSMLLAIPRIYLQNLSQKSMPCCTYMYIRGLTKRKEGIGLFQNSQKERRFFPLITIKQSCRYSHVVPPPCALQKKAYFPFSLAKMRIYFGSHLNKDIGDLF